MLNGIASKRDVYPMGNSAGGVHISSHLLEAQFSAERKAWEAKGIIRKGAINVGVPYRFSSAQAVRKDMLSRYYGSDAEIEAKCPCGLLKARGVSGGHSGGKKSRRELGSPKLLIMHSEFNPEGEILVPNREWVELAEKTWGEKMEVVEIGGHNHISPPMALGTGEGEEWGQRVVGWIRA